VHRDIKLENVLMNDSEVGFEVKLADFGAATICSSENFIEGIYGTL
jgi:serine/threonine protein kinase